MTADRELLELAAKASGLPVWFDEDGEPWVGEDMLVWNPLTDDGDALRLAADLGLWITRDGLTIRIRHFAGDYLAGPTWIEERTDSPDRYTSTRRAIVRAAAEIGKSL